MAIWDNTESKQAITKMGIVSLVSDLFVSMWEPKFGQMLVAVGRPVKIRKVSDFVSRGEEIVGCSLYSAPLLNGGPPADIKA